MSGGKQRFLEFDGDDEIYRVPIDENFDVSKATDEQMQALLDRAKAIAAASVSGADA